MWWFGLGVIWGLGSVGWRAGMEYVMMKWIVWLWDVLTAGERDGDAVRSIDGGSDIVIGEAAVEKRDNELRSLFTVSVSPQT